VSELSKTGRGQRKNSLATLFIYIKTLLAGIELYIFYLKTYNIKAAETIFIVHNKLLFTEKVLHEVYKFCLTKVGFLCKETYYKLLKFFYSGSRRTTNNAQHLCRVAE